MEYYTFPEQKKTTLKLKFKMELLIVFSVISIIFSGFLQTVTPALMSHDTESLASTVSPPGHTRTKRCSCATFLDKECVYFCHLDIIWVNTPERTVSYGLGSAPRKKRSVAQPWSPAQTPRCHCVTKEDSTCSMFCQPEIPSRLRAANLPALGSGCAAWQCLYNLAANKREIKRLRGRSQRSRRAIRWRRARAWEDEKVAS